MTKYTTEDIRKIAERLRGARDRERPAHFLLGAGCSISAGIPGAADLVKRIHMDYPAHCADLASDHRDSYGACMALLSLNERRDLIKPYLDHAKINWGTIAVAQLIVNNFIGRVLTANFDLVLENACGLLGLQPAVYDFGVAPANDPEMIVSPSIIHLHGQSYGLVLLNTAGETKKHREKLLPILKDTLRNAPLVVVGYSGSADGIFQTLFDEFEGRERLYWTSYEEEPKSHIRPFLKKDHFQFVGGADFDRFMIELAQSLGCWPPNFFANPLGHLLEELRPVVAYPVVDSETAIDLLGDLRRKLEIWQYQSTSQEVQAATLRSFYMKGDFEGAIRVFSSLSDQAAASDVEKNIASSSYINLGNAILEKAQHASIDGARALYQAANEKYQASLNVEPNSVVALNNWGRTLHELSKLVGGDERAKLLKEASKKYQLALAANPDYHLALDGLGAVLISESRSASDADALKLLAEADAKFQTALKIKPDAHGTLQSWAIVLIEQSKRTTGEEAARLLSRAEEMLNEAMQTDPTRTYNPACVAALKGDESKCRQYLEHAERSRTLPHFAIINGDTDLNLVRHTQWFQELLKRHEVKS